MGRVVRVLPDVAAIDKEFDYLVPDHLDARIGPGTVGVGTMVRVDLSGRRVGGWVVAGDIEAAPGVTLRPLARVRGHGPEPALVDLAAWAAWRWAGRRATLLCTASPDGAVTVLPAPDLVPPPAPELASGAVAGATAGAGGVAVAGGVAGAVAEATAGGTRILRLGPASDLTAVVALVARRGPTLVVVPAHDRAAVLAARLRRAGAGVALLPDGWAQARAGAAVVVGARAAAWGPCPGLAAVVVVDSHDESLAQQQAPTWHAATVAAARAERAGVPCVWITPCPTVEQLAVAPVVVTVARAAERAAWAPLEIIDRRLDDPRLGLYSDRLVEVVRHGGRVVVVLNRTGRARLLACGACAELTRCERCGAAVRQVSDAERPYPLRCGRCGTERPPLCAACGSTVLRLLRVGVTRVREELEVLAGRPVGEVTAASRSFPATPVLVGTEAVLHRAGPADAVAFLEFDQELLAPRLRAAEEALALLARASRLVGGRQGQGRGRVLVQTRMPAHPALQAALLADPERLSAEEAALRAALRFPPATALAVVSGPAAEVYAHALRAAGADVVGPDGDRWLVRAASAAALADTLAGVARPPGRLRVQVDPQRL